MKSNKFFFAAMLTVAMVACKPDCQWKLVGDHIMTEGGEHLSPENVHQE